MKEFSTKGNFLSRTGGEWKVDHGISNSMDNTEFYAQSKGYRQTVIVLHNGLGT